MGSDGNTPVTRQDLEDFKIDVNRSFEGFELRMESLLVEMEGRILTSVYRLAESINQRFKQNEGNIDALNARLAILEERLLELEKRLNIPTQTVQ